MMGSGCHTTSRGTNDALTLAQESQLRTYSRTCSYIPCHQYSVSTRDVVCLIPKCTKSSCDFLTMSVLSAGRSTSLLLSPVNTQYNNPLQDQNQRTLLLILSCFDYDAASGITPDTSRCMHSSSVHMSGGPPCRALGLAVALAYTLAALAITTIGAVYPCHTSADHERG